ncbi:GNAT family N-acetyltransferase [Nocardia testacea]|uniref:GNAT family N-acetyltransferase n=1 Tax=Nocardia testacea TaxID=248551 RepID=A0ABW7VPK1_9NOCA
MVQLRYYTDCDEEVQAKALEWAHTKEYRTRIGMSDFFLQQDPPDPAAPDRTHNWVILVGKQPVGLISAGVTDHPSEPLPGEEPDDPADYPTLGTVTYIDPLHRGRGYAGAAKRVISEHDAADGVRTFCCVVAADNEPSLKAIRKAGYECVRIEQTAAGKPDRLHFRRPR